MRLLLCSSTTLLGLHSMLPTSTQPWGLRAREERGQVRLHQPLWLEEGELQERVRVEGHEKAITKNGYRKN